MSRPTTRSKNKRHKPDNNEGFSSEILRKIHLTGEITEDDIHQLYMVWKPVCQGCRINTKDNPNCFCGLVPPSGGTRKSGLWQKMPDIVLSLGPDPCKDLRVSNESPAGLTNLGATCYANSILQCLYMNTAFRRGVFSIELDLLKKQPVLHQLARLFAQLHSSKMAVIDSAPFIKTLELDNGVQQDSHEFLTLLLSLLERSLSHSKISKARTIVQDLFRGSVSNVTRCSMCGRDSEASSKMEDFYELELNIKDIKNLNESLDDYLSVEELKGDNQYFCESCGERVNATRCIKLRTLPYVLNFQLKRYVFLPKTTTKKKITSLFSFPRELDMGRRLSEPSLLELIYDLSAVLIHKGNAVNSGHYVAHIKDEHTGQWWEFDDEHVSMLGDHPFGEGSSSSTAKPVWNEPLVQSSCTGEKDSTVNGNHINTGDVQMFSSADAYMLMYKRRTIQKVDNMQLTGCGSNNMETPEKLVYESNDYCPPFHLLQEIKELNASYDDTCQQYKLKKEKEVENITERRQEVRSVLSEAPVHPLEESYFWISTDWLRQWADSITPPVLDNTSIQCLHGGVPVSKVGAMKRLSTNAWNKLLLKYNGGPALSNKDNCINCLLDGAHSMVSADNYRDRRASMKELAEAALAGRSFDGPLYYVSRAWLLQWLRRKNVDSPCEADAGPTASIRCPHGLLMPEQAAGAKHLLVPESLWLFFYESANAVKPDDLLGCSTFPVDSEVCARCSAELSQVACLEDSLRAAKLKQRQNHEKLVLGKSIALSPGCRYYLLPSSWLTKWRTYITASGKNVSASVEPESLDSILDSLKCEKHSQLLERPLSLTYKRGIVVQRVSNTDGLTIITEDDWKFFCEEWNCTEEKGISAKIEFPNCVSNKLPGSCKDVPVLDEHLSISLDEANDEAESSLPIIKTIPEWNCAEEKGISAKIEFPNCVSNKLPGSCKDVPVLDEHLSMPLDEASDEAESNLPIIKTIPEICENCIGERESCELMRKLSYCNENICVYLVRGKEAPRSILEASATFVDSDRRTSKRSRKTPFGNSVNLKVSGSTSIYQLKMMIWESLGVVKENQILHKGSRVIDGESATLADMNIFSGDVLWVTDSEVHENRDIADELSEGKMVVEQTEAGFRGTLLTSNITTQ